MTTQAGSEDPAVKRGDDAGILITFRESPGAVKALLVGLFVNKLGQFIQVFLVLFLTNRGFTAVQAGAALSAYGAGSVLGLVVGGTLTDSLGVRRALRGINFLRTRANQRGGTARVNSRPSRSPLGRLGLGRDRREYFSAASAAPFRHAGFFAEQLGHHRARRDPARDHIAVLAVICKYIIVRRQCRHEAHDRRLFA